jgi:hypothetical protein
LFYFSLGTGSGLSDSVGAPLQSLLAALFLGLKDCHARFAKALLVFGGSRLSHGNIHTRFLNGPGRLAMTFRKNAHQWPVH